MEFQHPNSADPKPSESSLRWLETAVLALSFILRAALAYGGGQQFWPDEDRFAGTRFVAHALLDGRLHDAAELLFGHADHMLFRLVSLPTALLEIGTSAPEWVTALFFAAVSTWVLWLIGRTARAAGASPAEGLIAVVLAACANSLFYYSRHYFPYDLSLGCQLIALVFGLRSPPRPRDSWLVGLWAGLGFLVYNGYWTLTVVVILVHITKAGWNWRLALRCVISAGAGLLLPLSLVIVAGAMLKHNLVAAAVQFASTVTLGDLGRAGWFVPEYFWVTERGLAIVWAVALGLAVRQARDPLGQRQRLWSLLCVLLAALLILPSDLFQLFAVSARHVRALSPFLSLAAASVFYSLLVQMRKPVLVAGLFGLTIVQAAWNFATPLTQVFPREFLQLAEQRLTEERRHDLGPYRVVNCDFLHNPDWVEGEPDHGRVILRKPHPFQFAPYLFEGYTAEARARYQAKELSMRIVRLDAGGTPFHDHPAGLMELTLRFSAEPVRLLPEPLLTTGRAGAHDIIFIRYEDRDHIRLGHDHLGEGAVLSDILPLDRNRPHRLLVGMGSFYPRDRIDPARNRLLVMWDDTVALEGQAHFYPATPDDIAIGQNCVGATVAMPLLTARIIGFKVPVHPLGSSFTNFPGAVRLYLRVPPDLPPHWGEPLLASGQPGQGDLVFLQAEGDGQYRIGLDHWGEGAVFSTPFTLPPNRRLDLVIALCTYFPSASRGKHDRLWVSANNTVVMNRVVRLYPASLATLRVGQNSVQSTAAGSKLLSDILHSAASSGFPGDTALRPRPASVHFRLRYPVTPRPAQTEPLLCTGRNGAGDVLFVRFDDATHLRIGLDHWGGPIVLSESVVVDPLQPLDLTLMLGSLLPEPSHLYWNEHPEQKWLRQHLFVSVNNHIMLNRTVSFHPADYSPVLVGVNSIGASSTTDVLSADVLDTTEIPLESYFPFVPHTESTTP